MKYTLLTAARFFGAVTKSRVAARHAAAAELRCSM